MELSSRMSTTNLCLSTTWSQNSKQFSMHEVIRAAREFQLTRSEDSVKLINRHLSLLGVSIDKTIYDPSTSIVCEFFSTLYELLLNPEPRSTLAWGAVSVLETACKNQAARQQLIHTYQFIPLLAQLVNDQLTTDKKICILTVIQELSYGIKISWMVPNIQHLMGILVKWIKNDAETTLVVSLSLGIINNLCFKNPPAMYMLSRCVDIKQLATLVLKLKGNNIDALVCKFFIIIDHETGIVPEETFLRLLRITFNSIKEPFLSTNPMDLRQNIEFYFHVKVQGDNIRRLVLERLKDYPLYINKITTAITISSRDRKSEITAIHNPECMSLVFKFLKCVADLNLPSLEQCYEQQTRIALEWIQIEQVSSDALSLLRSIVVSNQWKSKAEQMQILELILDAMPIIFTNLKSINKGTVMTAELCTRLSNIMELLKILVEIPQTSVRVMAYLSQEQLDSVFQLTIGNNYANNFNQDAFPMYINTLSLINCIAKNHTNWQEYCNIILKHPHIHAILAEGLYNGSLEVRRAVLEIIQGNSNFPCDLIARTMTQLCTNVSTISSIPSSNHIKSNEMYYSLRNSITSPPNEAINILKEARNAQRINISTCDVMELYEFKIASMEHAERASMTSLEATSTMCTQLQHQVAQLTTELSRIRQLHLHTQHLQKDTEGNITALEKKVRDLFREKTEAEQVQEELKKREAENIAKLEKQIEDLTKESERLDGEWKNSLKINRSLQESIKKMQYHNDKIEEANKNLQVELSSLNNRILKTEELFKSTEIMLENKSRELDVALKESEERRKLIETIMKLAHTQGH